MGTARSTQTARSTALRSSPIVNRLLGREADEDYIADNLRKLNTFPDVSRKHWAYYAVMEAANAHTTVLGESESWSK